MMIRRVAVIVLLVLAALMAWLVVAGSRDDFVASQPVSDRAAQLQRGLYLVRAGDCIGCHTQRGQAAFSGGRVLRTPFGALLTPNITPDATTGIGTWTADEFWGALHNGRGRNGRLLYPAFPFPNYTRVTRPDADAMFAYLQSIPAIASAVPSVSLNFPFNLRPLLLAWRALYFRPGVFQPDRKQSDAWNRGAYLIKGLGHCDACHSDRNFLGATQVDQGLSGAQIPIMSWYAPSLAGNSETGLKDWPADDLTALLHSGSSTRAAVFGPMAEVVENSTQHLSSADLSAMVSYLQHAEDEPRVAPATQHQGIDSDQMNRGAKIYTSECADCHGESGEGRAGFYPPLANNRAVTMDSPVNTIRIITAGGYSPSTADNPRPYGMPPFAQKLTNEQMADVINFVRNSWSNHADPVHVHDIDQLRNLPLQ